MPVRKIPKNYLGVTGSFSSIKNGCMLGYESLLERDYMILLENDDRVERFEEQPVKIPFKTGSKPYVPDILVHFNSKFSGSEKTRPVLAEVKHTDDLKKNKTKYAPKFLAAEGYAQERGWQFRIVTEKDIRIACLDAFKFLREYLKVVPDIKDINIVLSALDQVKSLTVGNLIDDLCTDDHQKLLLVPTIWHLVAMKQIAIDYAKPITNATLLSLPKVRVL